MTEGYVYRTWSVKSGGHNSYVVEALCKGKAVARIKWTNGEITYTSEVDDGELRLKMEALLSKYIEDVENRFNEERKFTTEDLEDFYGW